MTVYIPFDSEYVFEIDDDRLYKIHSDVHDSKGKNFIMTFKPEQELEEYLLERIEIESGGTWRIMHNE